MATVRGARSLRPEPARAGSAASVSYDVENLHDTALRRCVDLLVALAGLVVLSPVLLVLMPVAWPTAGGPSIGSSSA